MHYREFHRRTVARIRREQLTIAAPGDIENSRENPINKTVLKFKKDDGNVLVEALNRNQWNECPK